MINEEIITTIFDEVIYKQYRWKCGKGGFNKQVLSTFNNFREESKKYTNEKALFVTNKGEIVWSKIGDKNSVTLDNYEGWLQGEKHGLIHIEHNHPTIKGLEYFPSILSSDDIRKMITSANSRYLYRSITAEYPNGTRMSISKTRDFGNKHDWDKDDRIEELCKQYDGVVTEYVFMYKDKMVEYTGLSKEDLVARIGSDESWGNEEYRRNICKKVTGDIGSLQNYLESRGIVDDFLKEGLVLNVSGERSIYG